MRFRVWAGLTTVALGMSAGFAAPAAAQEEPTAQAETSVPAEPVQEQPPVQLDPYQTGDVLGMVESVALQDYALGKLKPTFWFDIGTSLPTGTFSDRNWTNGFALQIGSEFWSSGLFGVDGRLGVFLNEDSRFNEAQSDSFYSAPGGISNGGPVVSRRHLLAPFSVEFKLDTQRAGLSPFISFGPSINWSRESTAYQDSSAMTYIIYVDDGWPTDETVASPQPGALTAHSVKNVTKIHPGYGGTAGFRFRFANTASRLMVTLNTWYERSAPISVIGAFISFGL